MKIDEIARLKRLAGIPDEGELVDSDAESNMSITGSEKREIERKKGIEPGTPEWFRLWFSNVHLTGETPYDDDDTRNNK